MIPACPCLACVEDREIRGCVNPHRCAMAAQSALDRLRPLWQPGVWNNTDDLSLTKSRKRKNRTARAANDDILFDPSIRTALPLAEGFRIFLKTLERTDALPRRLPRPFNVIQEDTTVFTDGSCTENGGTNAVAGSGIWYGPGDARNLALRVPGEMVTNQTAELYAVTVVAQRTPPFAPLHVVSDSRFVVDGLTVHLPKWEDRGWIGVAHADAVKSTVAWLRRRSAVTTFRWVKGHSGVPGNEAADRLAQQGCEIGPLDGPSLPDPPDGYVAEGIRLNVITQRLAYRAILLAKPVRPRRGSERMIGQVLAALRDWKYYPAPAAVWASLRKPDMRRSMRDFWWKALHGALRVGEYWNNIPGYEGRMMCAPCGAAEDLDHILLQCRCVGQDLVWRLARAALRRAGIELPVLNLGALLAAPCISAAGLGDKPRATNDRLLRIVLTESVHLVWKLRCERVVDPDFDPRGHSLVHITNRWLDALNRRLTLDQQTTNPRLGKAAVPRDVVLATWTPILRDCASLPADWIFHAEVLVGNPLTARSAGIG